MKIVPNDIEVLVRISIRGVPKDSLEDWVQNSVQRLLRHGLIVLDDSEYACTDKGRVWVDGLVATPLPVPTWRVPERGE